MYAENLDSPVRIKIKHGLNLTKASLLTKKTTFEKMISIYHVTAHLINQKQAFGMATDNESNYKFCCL